MWLLPATLFFSMVGITALFWFSKEKSESSDAPTPLHPDYFRGLNYLINEQPDKAVDVFIRLLEVDTDTVEMHLALGNLFRQRGEVDRAIRIHQNLIARPKLDRNNHLEALAALGEDYLKAGVLDRAEKLFLELVRLSEKNQRGLQFLLEIYQQEKEWLKAIEIAKKIESYSDRSKQTIIAQFYCELALQEKEKNQCKAAEQYLKRAAQTDKCCVRASIMKGDAAYENADYASAISHYCRVKNQDPDYMTEVIQSIVKCYEALNDDVNLKDFLMHCLAHYPSDHVVFAISHYLQRTENSRVAIAFLTEQIKHTPSLRGLQHLIMLYVLNSQGDTKEKLTILQSLIQTYTEGKPLYQCTQCGFATQSLVWLCPSCHRWVTVKPIRGLEGVINEKKLIT